MVLYSGNINPEQVLIQTMDCNSTKTGEYFTDAYLLERIPQAMFYLAAVYAALILIGLLMITENPKIKDEEKPKLSSKLIKTFQFLCTKILNTRDFWFLFLSRYSNQDFLRFLAFVCQVYLHDHHCGSLDVLEVSQS